MGFKKGDKVVLYLSGAGHVTQEDSVVARVTKKGVWLDNGPGNDESGPFHPVSGWGMGAHVPGFRTYIKQAQN